MLKAVGLSASITASVMFTTQAQADPQYAISMYGTPDLPPDFVSLPYANPNAIKGGTIKMGEVGTYDSLNPHIIKGSAPWQLRFLANETLMGRSWDEPFTLYGLIAETIEVGENREWVEFVLRKEARFADGSPITVEDVLWSYETLGTIGNGRYRGLWSKIEKAEQTGDRSVRFTFNDDNPELALLAGMRPILKKSQWDGKDFTVSGVDVVPITSAPYQIAEFEAGKFLTLRRNPDYWGKDLAFRRGTDNVDEIKFEYFGDGVVMFEAFKSGEIDMFREGNAEKWATQFDFPRVQSGDVVLSEIPHQRPTGMRGLVMNARKPVFQDWRVRQAMIQAFNFEYINETQNAGRQNRITSYFSNSSLGMSHDPAIGKVQALLSPFADQLLPGTLEGYSLPQSDGTQRNRTNIREAKNLLTEAGFTVTEGVLTDPNGNPFTFEILLRQGAVEYLSIVELYLQDLKRLGISANVTLIDNAQYNERVRNLDFDMTPFARSLSLSPGNEQVLYWGSDMADAEGTRNLMGLKSKVMDHLLDQIMKSATQDDLKSVTKAMDRVLMAGRYVIPIYHDGLSRIAHNKALKKPENVPIYGDRIGYFPDVWWIEE